MLNFGKISEKNKHICFEVPDSSPSSLKIPKLSLPKLTGPKLPNVSDGILDFGKKIKDAISDLTDDIEKFKPPGLPFKQLGFGLPELGGLDTQIKGLKFPKTICLTAGGQFGVIAVLQQLTDGIKNSNGPKFPILLPPIPDLSGLPFFPLSNIIPSLRVGPIIDVNKSMGQILAETKDRCARYLLDELDGLDPSLRLLELIKRLQELCGLLQFSQMQDIIGRIQQAKADLVRQALDGLTEPVDKLAKLFDMAVDAINTGAQDILAEIARLVDAISFEHLIEQIQKLNPRDALRMLNAEIKRQTQLRNFGAIRQLLQAINIVKSQLQEIKDIGDAILDTPENLLDALQSKIDELVDLENYEEIEKFLSLYDAAQDEIIRRLREMDLADALRNGTDLLNDALKRLDLGRYNRIMEELAGILCPQGLDIFPNIPNVPQLNPEAIPSFLR